jgi:hypothetical protein
MILDLAYTGEFLSFRFIWESAGRHRLQIYGSTVDSVTHCESQTTQRCVRFVRVDTSDEWSRLFSLQIVFLPIGSCLNYTHVFRLLLLHLWTYCFLQ